MELGEGMNTQVCFAQKALIEDDGRLLLIQKSDGDPNQPGKWEIPGGRLEFGEDIDDHLMREVREEVGLEVLPGAPFYVWQWRLTRHRQESGPVAMQIVAVARYCKLKGGTPSLSANVSDDYLKTWAWVPLDEVLSYDLIENMRPVIHAYLEARQPQASAVR